ncbi:MAG: hypothetical protein LM561_05860 [Desulfurococcaceae archaeon]|jgi:hypothetical protein|nr:hypothetical protein [Desulfurococcaceae archaeon]
MLTPIFETKEVADKKTVVTAKTVNVTKTILTTGNELLRKGFKAITPHHLIKGKLDLKVLVLNVAGTLEW